MVVRIEVLPSGARLYTGVISQKRLANKHKRYISLCSPKTTADITIIAELIRKEPLPKTTQNISSSHPHPNTQKKDPPSDAYHLEACGHLAAAAIAGTLFYRNDPDQTTHHLFFRLPFDHSGNRRSLIHSLLFRRTRSRRNRRRRRLLPLARYVIQGIQIPGGNFNGLCHVSKENAQSTNHKQRVV